MTDAADPECLPERKDEWSLPPDSTSSTTAESVQPPNAVTPAAPASRSAVAATPARCYETRSVPIGRDPGWPAIGSTTTRSRAGIT